MSSKKMEVYVPVIQKLAARLVLFHEAVAQKAGLHVTDVKALRLLGDETMTAGQLVELTGLTGASVTALVDRLEASGYVTRERDLADRRAIAVRANPAKVRTLDDLYSSMGKQMSGLLSTYGEVEFAAIMDYLTRATEILASETTKLRTVPLNDTHGSNNGKQSKPKQAVPRAR